MIILPECVRRINSERVTTLKLPAVKSNMLALRYNRIKHRIAYAIHQEEGLCYLWKYPSEAEMLMSDLNGDSFRFNMDGDIHYGVIPLTLLEGLIHPIPQRIGIHPTGDSEKGLVITRSSTIALSCSSDPCFPNMGVLGESGEYPTYALPNALFAHGAPYRALSIEEA